MNCHIPPGELSGLNKFQKERGGPALSRNRIKPFSCGFEHERSKEPWLWV